MSEELAFHMQEVIKILAVEMIENPINTTEEQVQYCNDFAIYEGLKQYLEMYGG